MDRFGRSKSKLHGHLYPGLMASGDDDSIEAAMAQCGAVGFDGVFAGIEGGEAVGAVPGGGGARQGASDPIAEEHRSTGEGRRMQISEFAGE